MKILLIHYRPEPPWSVRELINASKNLGHEPLYVRINELDAYIINGEIRVMHGEEQIIGDAGVVRGVGLRLRLETFMRRMGLLEALNIYTPLINKPYNTLLARDKWLSLLMLAKNNIPVPETVITENPFTAKRFVEKHGRAVFKPLMGSLGLGSTLLLDPDIAFHISRTLYNLNLPSYLQAYIEKPGYDFRVFVVGDHVVGAMKRVGVTWKTNIAQGARGIGISESDYPEVFDLGIKSAKILGLDYAGIDIVYDTINDKYYVIEVNAFPQWRGLKTATGVDPAIHIIEYLVNNVRR
jgi:ribosomal protein S6--L-glutamate ligase